MRAARCAMRATAHQYIDQLRKLGAQRRVFLSAQVAAQPDRYVIRSYVRATRAKRFTDQPLGAITVYCPRRDLLSCDRAQSRTLLYIGECAGDEIPGGDAYTRLQYSLEFGRPTQHTDLLAAPCTQTASRARPLALRALITARPALVFMRALKPWVRARRVLEG